MFMCYSVLLRDVFVIFQILGRWTWTRKSSPFSECSGLKCPLALYFRSNYSLHFLNWFLIVCYRAVLQCTYWWQVWGNLMLITLALKNELENGFLYFIKLSFSWLNVVAFTTPVVLGSAFPLCLVEPSRCTITIVHWQLILYYKCSDSHKTVLTSKCC